MTSYGSPVPMDKYQWLGTDVLSAAEFLPGKLYFVTFRTKRPRCNTETTFYINSDNEFTYNGFFSDFGPLNLGQLYRYCEMLKGVLSEPDLSRKTIVHWTTADDKKRANAAFLIGSFAITELEFTPKQSNTLLHTNNPMLYKDFQDANAANSAYTIRLIDCFSSLNKALYFGFVRFEDFDIREYETYEMVQNGDMNWIVPGKILAFSGPTGAPMGTPPEQYVPYFEQNNVVAVVRLNKPCYDSRRFIKHGIGHYELFFTDGSVPPKSIVIRFLEIVEQCHGAVAIHCKAGLGRTGCLIGSYLLKHYGMTALEAIAWMRICRPGCVIGHQQTWLEQMQPILWRMGKSERLKTYGTSDFVSPHKTGIYSLVANQKRKAITPRSRVRSPKVKDDARMEITQGDLLRAAKVRKVCRKSSP